jgi:hypothetical protein
VVLSIVYALPVRERIMQVYGSGSSGNADREEKEPEVQATAQATDMLPEEEQTDYQAMTRGAQSGEKFSEEEVAQFRAWQRAQKGNQIQETRKRRLQRYVDGPLVSLSPRPKMMKS